MGLFTRELTSLVEGITLPEAAADRKAGTTVGKYRLGKLAIYRPDDRYLPYEAVEMVRRDKGTVHVTGCCAGGVFVDRLVAHTAAGPFVFEFDSVKAAEKAKALMEEGKKRD